MSKLKDLVAGYMGNDVITKEKIKKTALLAVLAALALIAFVVNSGDNDDPNRDGIPQIDETVAEDIYVDIGGAVNEPKLAQLPQGSRVEDAIVAAGGLAADADVSNINRAEFLEDGEKVYIPERLTDEDGEDLGYSGSSGSAGSDGSADADAGSAIVSSASNDKININTADSTQLQQLNGVGPATAQKIIDYRSSNGRFKKIEDIKNVSGIGDKTFEKLKDYITI